MKTNSSLRTAALAGPMAALLALTLGTGSALAATWNDGAGSWGDSARWTGTVPNAAGETAGFQTTQSGSRNVTLDADRTVGILELGFSSNNRGLTLQPGSGGKLILDNGGSNAQINFKNGGGNANITVATEIKSHVLIANIDTGGNKGFFFTGGLSSTNGHLTITNTSHLNSRTKFDSTVSDGAAGNSITYNQTAGWTEFNQANTFTGTTTNVTGSMVLGNSLALQNSALDTTASGVGNAGDPGNGLKIRGITTLTLGGLTGNKAFGSLFNTVINTHNLGYGALTALTLNPGTGANHTYTGNIVEGAAGMTVAKTGAGTQDLNGAQAYNTLTATGGTTNVNGLVGTVPASGTASVAVTGAGTKLRFGSVSQTLSSLSIGAGSTVVFTSGVASGPFSEGGGKTPSFGGSTLVPEPGTLGLLLVGALGVLHRRRRLA